jgi:hypothetical protein
MPGDLGLSEMDAAALSESLWLKDFGLTGARAVV